MVWSLLEDYCLRFAVLGAARQSENGTGGEMAHQDAIDRSGRANSPELMEAVDPSGVVTDGQDRDPRDGRPSGLSPWTGRLRMGSNLGKGLGGRLGTGLSPDAKLFWSFQIAIWFSYFMVRALLAMSMDTFMSALTLRAAITLTGFCIGALMWHVLRHRVPQRIGPQVFWLGVMALGGAVIMGSVEAIGQVHLSEHSDKYHKEDSWFTAWLSLGGWGMFVSTWVLVAWGGLYLSLDYSRRFQAEHLRAVEAAALAHQAQLKMLRYQLNPHFLFNTLNALSALVLTRETDRAEQMILGLSKFLRHTLDSDPLARVPLSRELWALSLYLDIEKERFAERLTVVWDIDDNARSCLVPSLLLQPLIENALKHAIARCENGGVLTISASRRTAGKSRRSLQQDSQSRQKDLLVLSVSDDGPGIPEAHLQATLAANSPGTDLGETKGSKGVGLRNTMSRLQRIYAGAALFEARNLAPHGLQVTITIPAEDEEPQTAETGTA